MVASTEDRHERFSTAATADRQKEFAMSKVIFPLTQQMKSPEVVSHEWQVYGFGPVMRC